ncbi:rho GTPase-activating protein 190 isoform X1 [Anopheles darlingi]|uniref:rho GTPase-activating protein 190 isoform X1 n=1 Tax=Anopheles darlingi TaxID=43151 RepID=UPI0021003F3D|nr:rho GTPase-activating protein 190 isoform X1 [Anopheles darlingi]XP_049537247.1 rho GTPase-activating protein 190 isoform X1 [Anopheles darlingi]XP_049537256.1 rho GTPase-activating protein 190 isoform X1 [Anopheles darlingi]XP_049537266.1 rho GTPase-activating protein 190 isoform X1 [Anopheles darlingi]XP_049537276.1 rho GTPase-activating protein 190 isoform X1 [Anopheles darlingi]
MKQINVSVVGLSGVEKDKGQLGVGKSCLCNRFVRPKTDDYAIDHISVLSQSDFSGRVVNNDHFLYWGEVRKTSDEGVEYNFSVVEQTEFVDDATFQPFKVGKMEPYIKRCAAVRLSSQEKLKYICKNQLGIEHEYEEVVLPEGRFLVDGFVCVFDVSVVPNRPIEKQVEFVTQIIASVMKNKKPIVLVTTKNDDASEQYVREAEKICSRKEYKGQVLLVETSAHESINIDLAFVVLAQMIDKAKQRSKIPSYGEAARQRTELLNASTEYVTRLIRTQITDHRSLWTSSSKKLASHREWSDFLELFGQEAGQRIFRRHLKKLREDYQAKKLQSYMDAFANVLQELLPDINSINLELDSFGDWPSIRGYFRNHMEYDQYFFDAVERGGSWAELSDMSDMEDEHRIPFDILDTPDAETIFKNHMNALQQEQKRLEWKKQFKKLLEETGYVTPGKQLSEVRVLFMGRECFEALSEHDCQQIYDNHQRELIETAKHNFQELLMEHADLFYHFKNIEPSGTITQNDIKEITDVLQEDLRYKLLDRLDQDRKLMLFQHLGFVHCPIREHCPAFPNCVDALIERILLANQTLPNPRFAQKDGQLQLNLIVIGLDYIANDFIDKIHQNCNDNGEYIVDGQVYGLNIETINRDNDSFSFELQSKGLICCYSNRATFQYVYEVLDRLLVDNLDFKDSVNNLHIVFMSDDKNSQSTLHQLQADGQSLAEKLHCVFIDENEFYVSQQQAKFIDTTLNSVIDSIPFEDLKYGLALHDLPDLRLILCLFCGDPFSIENLLSSLMLEQSCVSAGERNIIFEMFLGDSKRRVELILSSYHGANAFRDDLIHGFILLYSSKRKASLSTLSAFSLNIPNLPMQIVAVAEQGGVNAFFNSELSQLLITEGNAIADKLRAHFATGSDDEGQFRFASFAPFLKEVWDKKPEIEHAFNMEEPLTIDSGEGTMEHSMHHHHPQHQQQQQQQVPQPPPRYESYLINGSSTTYRGAGQHGHSHHGQQQGLSQHQQKMSQQLFDNRSINSLDDFDSLKQLHGGGQHGGQLHGVQQQQQSQQQQQQQQQYNNMYYYEDSSDFDKGGSNQGFQIYPPPTTPPEPAPPDHLLTPSSILRQLKANTVSQSQSSLEEINSDVSGSKDSINTYDSGWLDDGFLIPKQDNKQSEDLWKNVNAHHAFTTGRRPNQSSFAKKIRPKGPSQTLKQPGKLNLKSFAIVNEAIARMNVSGGAGGGGGAGAESGGSGGIVIGAPVPMTEKEKKKAKKLQQQQLEHAPLAAPEDDSEEYEDEAGYEQINDAFSDAVNNVASQLFTFSSGGAGRAPDGGAAGVPAGHDLMATNKNKLRQRREKEQSELSADGIDPLCYSDSVLLIPNDSIVFNIPEYSDSESDSSSLERKRSTDGYSKINRKAQPHKRHRKKRTAIPVQPPKIPMGPFGGTNPSAVGEGAPTGAGGGPGGIMIGAGGSSVGPLGMPSMMYQKLKNDKNTDKQEQDESSIDVSSPRDNNSPIFGVLPKSGEREKLLPKQKNWFGKEIDPNSKSSKESKESRSGSKSGGKLSKSAAAAAAAAAAQQPSLASFKQSDKNLVPLFVEKCVKFIEQEGLDSEGIYRVPGNRTHVDLLYQKFEEEVDVDIEKLDIPVNAVATALKDFFAKRLPALFSAEMMSELEEIAGSRPLQSITSLSMEVKTDRSCRLIALRGLLNKLPPSNFAILSFIFQHFVRVSENSKLNSMDSKNLAICWWPTLLPIEFTDMMRFETMRPYLEDIVQTMIDQFPFLFCGEEAFVMV